MLTVISPAKTLDFETPPGTRKATQPQFLARAAELVEDARALSPDEIRALMGVSTNIADLNHRRFMDWGLPFSLHNAKQALLMSDYGIVLELGQTRLENTAPSILADQRIGQLFLGGGLQHEIEKTQ